MPWPMTISRHMLQGNLAHQKQNQVFAGSLAQGKRTAVFVRTGSSNFGDDLKLSASSISRDFISLVLLNVIISSFIVNSMLCECYTVFGLLFCLLTARIIKFVNMLLCKFIILLVEPFRKLVVPILSFLLVDAFRFQLTVFLNFRIV